MLALFSRFVRWLKPDGERALKQESTVVARVVNGQLRVTCPLPQEDELLSGIFTMENGGQASIVINLCLTRDGADILLNAVRKALRAETPVRRETQEH